MEVWAAKVICLFLLLLLSLGFGLLPLAIVAKLREGAIGRRGHSVLSYLNCFSGGVFLATSFLHLLPDVKEQMTSVLERAGWRGDFPVTEAVVCGGFYVIMLLEHVIMTLRQPRRRLETPDHVTAASNIRHVTGKDCQYGNITSREHGNGKMASGNPDVATERTALLSGGSREVKLTDSHRRQCLESDVIVISQRLSCESDVIITECESQPRHHHHGDSHQETSQLHGIRSLVLCLALSLHTVFEGLALGLQTSTTNVWTLFTALALHKVVIAFTLGLQLTETLQSKTKVASLISVFAIVAPLGVAIGTAITASEAPSLAIDTASAILQGIATGTFLYVTFFEVLQTEIGNDHSVSKVLCTLVGSVCIAGLNLLEADDLDTVNVVTTSESFVTSPVFVT